MLVYLTVDYPTLGNLKRTATLSNFEYMIGSSGLNRAFLANHILRIKGVEMDYKKNLLLLAY